VQSRFAPRGLLPILALALAYWVTGKFGLSLSVAHGSATPVWPPTGVALAVLLLFGRRLWPGVALGAFLVNITGHAPLLFSVLAALGNTAAVVLTLEIIERQGGVGALDRFRQVVVLVVASLLCSTVSATVGTSGLLATRAIPWSDAGFTWWVWWLGDSLGFILFAPVLLAWADTSHTLSPNRRGEALALALLLVGVSVAVFGPGPDGSATRFPFSFAVLPFVLWAALRFEQPGATLATLVVSGVALWGVARTHGPLSPASQGEVLLWWQGFSMIIGLTSLGIAGTATERNRAEAALRDQSASLEQQVADRTAALLEQNAQMLDFTHTISHDLRAPLRAIRGYTDALVEDLGAHLGPVEREYTERIISATQRMDALLQGLLEYSRLAEVELAHEPVALGGVVTEALALLEFQLNERGARVHVDLSDELPLVIGHRPVLVQAVVNLLLNAATYVSPHRQPEIRVGARERPGHVCLWVRDNGIGIHPEHHERIFRMFERLHPEGVYGGTGVGLAMVKRAVERMGGTIQLDSDLGRGSEFWIELQESLSSSPATNGHGRKRRRTDLGTQDGSHEPR
jgi:signal transduction histidine kinase